MEIKNILPYRKIRLKKEYKDREVKRIGDVGFVVSKKQC